MSISKNSNKIYTEAQEMKNEGAEIVLQLISIQLAALESFKSDFNTRLPIWRDRTISLLSGHVFVGELQVLRNISISSWNQSVKEKYMKYLIDLIDNIQKLPDYYLIPPKAPSRSESVPVHSKDNKGTTATVKAERRRVFVVHGHDSLVKLEVTRTLEKLGLDAIVLHEQPNEGRTIIEKFERNAETVDFAVVLMTPDDFGHPANKPEQKRYRTRQNVILELGYFCGALGRHKVCALHKGDIEIPSDYLGMVYVPFDNSGAWKFNLVKELKRAGLMVDANKLT